MGFRAVLITATALEPRRNGKTVVLGGILDHLRDRLGTTSVHVVQIGRPDDESGLPGERHHLLAKPSTPQQVLSVLANTVRRNRLARRRLSLQESLLRSPSLEHRLWATLAEIDADLEIWDTVRTGQFVTSSARWPSTERRARRILYADDLFSLRYTSLLSAPTPDPGGEFARLLPRFAGRLLASPRVHRPALRLERRLVAEAEQRQPPWFDGTYLISPAETRLLRSRCPDARIGTLPPLLPAPRPRPRKYSGGATFVVLGSFDYAPNQTGLDWFLRSCRDAVLARMPTVKIVVIGPGTERGLPSAALWGDAVEFLGWVDELDLVMSQAAALLSPLRSGSGVKIKVLQALARGLPVVATTAGVQGVVADGGCLVADTPAGLAEAMRTALDPATNARLSDAARLAWATNYHPDVVRPRYDQVFGLAERGAEPTPFTASSLVEYSNWADPAHP